MAKREAILITEGKPRRMWPLLLIALAVAIFFHSMILLRRMPCFSDIKTYYYPGWLYFSAAFKSGAPPLWCPGIYCGFPLFADSEMGLAYPINLLFFQLPADAGFNHSLVLHYLLGAWFAYLYCRRIRLGRSAALFAAVPFALGGFFISHLVHPNVVATAAWMPLFLYCLERALDETRMSFFVLAGGLVGLQFLSGFLMIPLMELILAFFYALCHPGREGESRGRFLSFSLGGLILAAALGLGLGMAQNLPSYHLVQNSYRAGGLSGTLSNTGSLPPVQLIGLVFPRVFGKGIAQGGYWGAWTFEEAYGYIGLLPLFFAPAAMLRPRRSHAAFFLGVSAVSLLLSLGNAGLLWRLFHLLPGFSVLKGASRFLLTFNLGLAVLGGMGFDRWRRGEFPAKLRRFLNRFWLTAFAVLAACIALFVILYRFNPFDLRDLAVAVARPFAAGIKLGPRGVLQGLYGYFTHPKPESLLPLIMLGLFLLLVRGRKGADRPARGWVALAVVLAVFDVLLFSTLVYDLIPVCWTRARPAVVQSLAEKDAGGRVALLKEPGIDRDNFPLCSNQLLPHGLDDSFGFSTIPPARLDRVLNRLNGEVSIPAYESLGVTHLFSDLVHVDALSYDLGMPFVVPGGIARRSYVYDDFAVEELRLLVDGSFLTQEAPGELYLGISAVEEEARTVSVLRLYGEGDDGFHGADAVAGERDISARTIFFKSPGYAQGRRAFEIRVPAALLPGSGRIVVTSLSGSAMAGTRLLAMEAVDHAGGGRPLTTLPLSYLDRDNAIYATPDPRPRAWFAPQTEWVDTWVRGVDAAWYGMDGESVFLVAGEVSEELRGKIDRLDPSAPPGDVYDVAEERDRVTLRSSNPSDAVLVLTMGYMPGWKASVDGEETPVFSADGCLTAIYLPRGEHDVELTYAQPGFSAGGWVTAVSVIAFALLVVAFRRRETPAGEGGGGPAPPPPSGGGISAFFPCYNDSATLEEVVTGALGVLGDLTDDHEVIIVDDGSGDGSGAIAERLCAAHPRVKVIRHADNRGYGAALRSGIAASSKGWVFYTDSDGQYDVEDLRRLHAWSGAADVVNGYKKGRSDAWYRKLMGSAYNLAVRAAFAIPIRDVDCDFRLMKGDLVRGLDLRSEGGAVCVEMVKGLEAAGAVFVEMPVGHHPRRAGKSQFFRVKNLVVMAGEIASLWWRLIIRGET